MNNEKVSIVIPARNEQFLQNTIRSMLENARGQIEIIVVLDGYWPNPQIEEDGRVIFIHRSEPQGMRPAINAAVAIARGKYVLKADAHCLFPVGFDLALKADCEKNWVVVPRRHRLDPQNWCIQDTGKPPIDYMYLSYPDDPKDFGGPGLNGKVWDELNRREDLKKDLITDLMSFQGSAWFMHRDYFYDLELMDDKNYGSFWNEAQEIGLKAWLSGGRVVRNKKTWYAHLHKGKTYGRGYHLAENLLKQGAQYTHKWLTNTAWHKQTKPLSWLIERFWPVPGWPEERKLWNFDKSTDAAT